MTTRKKKKKKRGFHLYCERKRSKKLKTKVDEINNANYVSSYYTRYLKRDNKC